MTRPSRDLHSDASWSTFDTTVDGTIKNRGYTTSCSTQIAPYLVVQQHSVVVLYALLGRLDCMNCKHGPLGAFEPFAETGSSLKQAPYSVLSLVRLKASALDAKRRRGTSSPGGAPGPGPFGQRRPASSDPVKRTTQGLLGIRFVCPGNLRPASGQGCDATSATRPWC